MYARSANRTPTSQKNPQIPTLVQKRQPIRMDPVRHHFIVKSNSMCPLEPFSPKKRTTSPSSPKRTAHIQPPHPNEIDEIPQVKSTTRTKTPQKSIRPNTSSHSKKIDTDIAIDFFFEKHATLPLTEAIESFCKHFFAAHQAIVWQEVPALQVLYSPVLGTTLSHSNGLVGYTFFSRQIIRAPNGALHPSFMPSSDEQICPYNSPVLLFPLWDYKNNISFIVEVVRPVSASAFTQDDELFTEWFTKKFKYLSRYFKQTKSVDSLMLELLPIMKQEAFLIKAQKKITDFFKCRSFEIWKMNHDMQKLIRYKKESQSFDVEHAGIVGDCLIRKQPLSIELNRFHSSYNASIDGDDEAVLAIPVTDSEGDNVYALVLRGPRQTAIFTKETEDLLKKAAPIILLAHLNSESFSLIDKEYQDSRNEREGLAALLEVVEIISSQLDTLKLTDIIMEKGRSLTNADRCSLFLVNEQRDRLITSLHQGLNNCIDIPINKGIAGKTVSEGKVLNIPDAYQTTFFDSSTDRESGYITKSILSVPIYSNRGEIIGVTEMVNKRDGLAFTQWDSKLIQIFNVFCGISLENARLYDESNHMAIQLRTFFDTAFAMAHSNNMQRVISDILQNAKNIIGAENATLLLVDEGKGHLSNFVSDNERMPPSIVMNSGIACMCAKTKESYIVNEAYSNPVFNRIIDKLTNVPTRNLLATPIIGSDNQIIGIAEILNKKNGDFLQKDLKVLQTFSAFASIALENSRLKDLAQYGDAEIEMKKWIALSERNSTEIPANLRLNEAQLKAVVSLNCFAVDFQGINHFKELFYFFSMFQLLEKYQITNEVFFRFIFAISSTYNSVPYHNWTHACDVTQYLVYEIKTANLDNVFTSFELFGLLTAAICHDANHEGLNNIYNVKAETPFGIVFKDQSVMEMHHITVAIPIITRDDINFFQALDQEETKKMWNYFIKLILATDMANHFTLVKECQALCDEGKWNLETPENRLLALKLLLKEADISNVSRPFNLANEWCDILNKEFFRQGDLEKSNGIGLTSQLNDRETSNKPKSQIGFYNFICLPLYQVVARIFPPLEANLNSLKSNLEVWKAMVNQSESKTES